METPVEFIRMMFVTGGENTPNPFPINQQGYEEVKAEIEAVTDTPYTGNPEDILSTVEGLEGVKLDIQG